MEWTDLTPFLSPIPWTLVDAAAARLYMPERATLDLDIAIHIQDAQVARKKLTAAGFVYKGELSIGGSTWQLPDGKIMDLIEGRDKWWAEALKKAQTNRDAQGLPVLPLPYLVLMKFQAGRVQDLADVTRMLGQASAASLDEVRKLFDQYAPSEKNDLESLIALGKLEED